MLPIGKYRGFSLFAYRIQININMPILVCKDLLDAFFERCVGKRTDVVVFSMGESISFRDSSFLICRMSAQDFIHMLIR